MKKEKKNESWKDKFVHVDLAITKDDFLKISEIAEEEETTVDLLLSEFVKERIEEGKSE